MKIDDGNLELAFKGFKAVYTDAYTSAPSHYDKIAMTVPSASSDETYGWLGQFPQLREWTGSRVIAGLQRHGFTIKNRKFESTVRVSRDDFSDDKFGIYKPMFAEMGHAARQHPDELIFNLLRSGFTELCFDGQNFFDTNHPSKDENNLDVEVSNMQDGANSAWYLLDTSWAIRPLIWQEREAYDMQQVTGANDHHVFMKDEYLYGVRARVNAGFGLWQMAYASRDTLNEDNYATARAAMMMLRGDAGRVLGISPNTLVVPPSLEQSALQLLNTAIKSSGGSNVWKGTSQLIVTPHVAD
jgi:phage major head subunit gpT-like protein